MHKSGIKNIKNIYDEVRSDEEIASGRFGATAANPNQIYSKSDRKKEFKDEARDRLKRDAERGSYASDEAETDKGQFLSKGGKVSSASSRADGIAQRGKTKGRML